MAVEQSHIKNEPVLEVNSEGTFQALLDEY